MPSTPPATSVPEVATCPEHPDAPNMSGWCGQCGADIAQAIAVRQESGGAAGHAHATSPTECDPECGEAPPHGTGSCKLVPTVDCTGFNESTGWDCMTHKRFVARQGQRVPPPSSCSEPPLDLSLYVAYGRHEHFSDSLELGGTHVKASISWRAIQAEFIDHKQQPVKPMDKRPFARLEHALVLACNGTKAVTEDEPAAVEVERKRNAIHLSSDEWTLQDLHAIVRDVSHNWRNGHLLVPTVSVDEHKQMVEFGIILRKDGLFGYNLLCHREGCAKRSNTCYAALTVHAAVEDIMTRRSMWTCSRECWMLNEGIEALNPDFVVQLYEAEEGTVIARVREAAKIPREFTGEPDEPTLDRLLLELRHAQPELWKEFLVEVENWAMDDDYFAQDGGSVACEA